MLTSPANRPTWAEINLDRLAENCRAIKKFVGESVELMAVVKADAYGHGAVECAKRLEILGINWLGVALPEEGLELRQRGIKTPILCLGSFWKGQENYLIENDLTPVIYQIEIAELLNRAASNKNTIADVHIKIDTGMGRIGVRFDQVKSFFEKLREYKNLRIQGILTHYAAADDLSENTYTIEQFSRFNRAAAIIKDMGFQPFYQDSANSPAAIAHGFTRSNLVRIGGILYGLGDDVLPAGIDKPQLRPVMSLHTRVAFIKKVFKGETLGYGRTFIAERDSLIASIPIGYQDGYSRSLSNRGQVIVKNQYVAVVGRISMDWTLLDVTDVQNVNVNDEVILIGGRGNLKVTAEEIAAETNTISYEITCGINRRVVRKYVESEQKSLV